MVQDVSEPEDRAILDQRTAPLAGRTAGASAKSEALDPKQRCKVI